MVPLLLTLLTTPPVWTVPTTLPTHVQTMFVKVAPRPGPIGRSPGQDRAVVLIHGLGLQMINQEKACKPYLRPYQQSDSPLVRRLARDSDVYALCYGQNASVESIALSPDLIRYILSLKAEGYCQIVLIGHSAGGLIARHLVEDHPELGVTRVIQVCAPNGGSGWAALKTARAAQIPFLVSLTRTSRQKVLHQRSADRRIPESVEFACVVGSCNLRGDGVVSTRSQWTADLQMQGIPAYTLKATHWEAMSCSRTPELLARIVVEPMPRWDAARVAQARKALLGH
jgi:pimeloyl-ACP methyl ester carboxylesterase